MVVAQKDTSTLRPKNSSARKAEEKSAARRSTRSHIIFAEINAQAAQDSASELRVTHLLDLRFDADFGAGGHSETKPLEANLEQTLENLHWSEHLVSLTPMWWGELPAEFKGLIDRVLLSGTACAPVKSSPAFLTATAQGVPIA
jgi:putative NADPH-quinone reductase